MMSRARRWFALVVSAAGVLSVFICLHFAASTSAHLAEKKAKPLAAVASVAAIAPSISNTARSRVPPPPAAPDVERVLRSGSLRGSQPDGVLAWTREGRLVADRELRRLLDYYLTTIGELDADAIRALLAKQLGAEYPVDKVAQVLAIFDRYRDYQLALMNVPANEDLHAQLARLHELRQRYLGTEIADAFFQDEENYNAYTLAQRDLAADQGVSAEQRQARAREIETQLPESLRDERTLAQTPALIAAQEAQLDADHADADTRHNARAAQWGEEAAQRLDTLDSERANWQARLVAYQNWRDAINANTSLNAAQRSAAIDALLARSFQDNERVRVLSLEQDGLLPPGG